MALISDTQESITAALGLTLVGLSVTCGCTTSSSVSESTVPKAKTASQVPVTQASVAATDLVVPTIDHTASVAQPADEVLATPADFDFFELPAAAPVRTEVIAQKAEHESIRLLGFVNPEPGNSAKRKALLRIGEHLVQASASETFRGIKLLEISDRSITLQREGARWTLAMFDQPIVNNAVAPPKRTRRERTRPARTSRRAVADEPFEEPEFDAFPEPNLEGPDAPPWQPDDADAPVEPKLHEDAENLGLPDDLGIELPHLEGLPDIGGLSN